MAYDKVLAERIQGIVSDISGSSSKEMFGGKAFMVNGNVSCGVIVGYYCVILL